MYNLRYHITSLVAVFLSLSIGLLLGTIVVERGTLDRQKESIIESLQEEFRTLNTANNELRESLTSREELVDALLEAAVEGSLEGRTVLVVASTGRADGLGSTADAIRSAGGTPVTLLLSAPLLGAGDPSVSSVVTETIGPVEPDALLDEIADGLAAEWLLPAESRPLTIALAEAGVLRVDGDGGAAIDAVAVLASFNGVPDEGALALARSLADGGAAACAIEAQSQTTGVAAAALESGLSGVDHIGTPEGAYSLTWILAGRAEGYYGIGDGAQAPWPR
ncbi:MAG: copper transporter [Anaerosomatales bacterium]|nr:copper transporter [Anaerosomatales bacterium]MDT8433223.1 copper transporter [Anaerosomatales bacterium]